jgi:2-polyprenyl-6-methoxyphenol hydroxylase-like FAD-dependent oxidoreductase
MSAGRVVIVGAGPAGAALAYLLARGGVGVTLLERHPDFERTFRGDGLQPSGIDAFRQMGLGDRLMQLPKAVIKTIELYQNGSLRARLATERLGFIGCFIPQPAVLTMLTDEARQYPGFRLALGTTVRDLVRVGDRVVGLRADGPDGPCEHQAELVIGTDGRYSTVRKRAAFPEFAAPQTFDILNFKVSVPDFWPDRSTVRLELGPGCITGGIPTSDGRLWVGMTVQKEQYKVLRTAGPEAWTEELLRRVSPDLAAHLRSQGEALQHPVLLNVMVGRLTTWTVPGLLLLGDAAHPMSPIAGQGINLALRDALVAANHLCPALTGGHDPAGVDAAARRVAAERMPEIVAVQEHQRKQAETFLRSDRLVSRLALRLLPLLVNTGLLRFMMRDRLRSLQHGVVPVRLTV